MRNLTEMFYARDKCSRFHGLDPQETSLHERVQPATIPERAASILKPRACIGFIQPTKGYGAYASIPLAFITATAEGDARNLAKASAPFGSRALARTPAAIRNFTPGRSGSGSSICTPGSVLKLRRCATPICAAPEATACAAASPPIVSLILDFTWSAMPR